MARRLRACLKDTSVNIDGKLLNSIPYYPIHIKIKDAPPPGAHLLFYYIYFAHMDEKGQLSYIRLNIIEIKIEI